MLTTSGTNTANLVKVIFPFGRGEPSGLRLVQRNARNVCNKLDELRLIMNEPKRVGHHRNLIELDL